MFANFDFDVIRRSLAYLFLDGMTFTLMLTGLAGLGGLVFGTLIALMRLSRFRLLGRIAGLYVDLIRSLPLVLVIFWFYFLVPYVGQWLTGASRPIHVGAFISSLVYVVSIPDFLGAASKVAQRDGRLVEMYLFAAVVYFAISCFASFGVRRLQSRIAIVR